MPMATKKLDEHFQGPQKKMFQRSQGPTKQNTQFRENTTKWRGVIGVGFVALIVEKAWSIITGG